MADVCDGTSAVCVDAKAPAGTVCKRAPADSPCLSDAVCDGETGLCPQTLVNALNKPCDDGDDCTSNDKCSVYGECRGQYTCACESDAQCEQVRCALMHSLAVR